MRVGREIVVEWGNKGAGAVRNDGYTVSLTGNPTVAILQAAIRLPVYVTHTLTSCSDQGWYHQILSSHSLCATFATFCSGTRFLE